MDKKTDLYVYIDEHTTKEESQTLFSSAEYFIEETEAVTANEFRFTGLTSNWQPNAYTLVEPRDVLTLFTASRLTPTEFAKQCSIVIIRDTIVSVEAFSV